MLRKKKTKLFLLFLLLPLILGADFVFALEINYPRVPGATPPQDFVGRVGPKEALPLYVNYIIHLLIWIIGLLAIGVLIVGGIRYLLSTGKPEAIVNARSQILGGFFGVLIILSSYLVLKAINPDLVILNPPELEWAELIEREIITAPTEETLGFVFTEIPFGRIIERNVFETYVPEEETRKPRMTRIRENVFATLDIATKLKELNEELKKKTDQCSCDQAEPCCDISGRQGCSRGTACSSKPGCTCDPCKNVRSDIEGIEHKNGDKNNNIDQINLLEEEQKKTMKEVKELKEELSRLERAEWLLYDCRYHSLLANLATYLIQKDFIEDKGWKVKNVKYWDDLDILIKSLRGGVPSWVPDWTTFYCPAVEDLEELQIIYEERMPLTPIPEKIEIIKQKASCWLDIPIGEIIDRTERTTKLLIGRLEEIIDLDRQMTKAVDEMHVLVSECTSQSPRCNSVDCTVKVPGCTSICYCVCEHSCSGRCCFKKCVGSPCPSGKIAEQLEKIKQIQEQIKIVVEGKEGDENSIRISVKNLIDVVVNEILLHLKETRRSMEGCVKTDLDPDIYFADCVKSTWEKGPDGETLELCCYTQIEFQECLEQCYLETGEILQDGKRVKNYQKCLKECMVLKGQTSNAENLKTCRHMLNFYCCRPQPK